MVSNVSEMISTIALVTRASAWVLKPQGSNEILEFQCGEAHHQNAASIITIPNPIGLLNSNGVLKRVHNFIPRFKAPTCLLGVTKAMCEAPLFSTETMAILDIQPIVMFRLATTLCECGRTPNVVVKSEDTFVPPIVPHLVSKANHITKCPRFNLNLGMWLYPNFMTFQCN